MKKRLSILTLAILVTFGLPDMPAKDGNQAAFTATAASCPTSLVYECQQVDGIFFHGCCKCSLLEDVQACTAASGTWDYCSATCT